jgi:hypothetical protein
MSFRHRETQHRYSPWVYVAAVLACIAAAVKFNLISVRVEPVELEDLLLEKIQVDRDRAAEAKAAEVVASSSDEQQIKVGTTVAF